MESTQSFKNKIMKELYPLLNNNDSISEEFLKYLNNSKMGSLEEKLSEITSNLNINELDESMGNSYTFFKSLADDKTNEENLGFGTGVKMSIPYSELIEQITNSCKNALRNDFQEFAKIHENIKNKLDEKKLLDKNGPTLKQWLLQDLPVPSNDQQNSNYNNLKETELINEQNTLVQKFNSIINGHTSEYVYYIIELVINRIKQIMYSFKFNISSNNVDFLLHFYHNNMATLGTYLNLGLLDNDSIFQKVSENLELLFNNNSYFSRNIKVLDNNSNQDILKLVSYAILSFTKNNSLDIQATSTKSLYMIDSILANMHTACTPHVKMSLDTFDYILMQFITTYKSRMHCVGIMHVFSILRSINNNSLGNLTNTSHTEEQITSMLLNSSPMNSPKKIIELEYLLIHRILNTALRHLLVSEVYIEQIVKRIELCMNYVVRDLSNDTKSEYLNKYKELLKIKTNQYPLNSFADTLDNKIIKFWWITPQEKLQEKQITV